ncbi:MAG: flavin oxidoreductase/NADH oxidase [Planctomycetes bacterium]|nr:flavin oxidoreductase/NADH oxidase [Planctomycetota bacterium]
MTWQCKFKTLDDLESIGKEHGAVLEASADTSCLKSPVSLGQLQIPNSLAVHPMEGCDGKRDGSPDELTIRRYDRFAAGGCGLLWVEAIAVAHEGRANPRQLWIHKDNTDQFKGMNERMFALASESMGSNFKPTLVAQLTHSGRYAKPDGTAKPIVMREDPHRDAMAPEPFPTSNRPSKISSDNIISDDDLNRLQDEYLKAAHLAAEAGFDAVDIKACHGYLISEMLSSHTRPGKYGGSFENRTRFLLEVIARIKSELGNRLAITTRLGCYDATPYPYGWGVSVDDYKKPDLEEPKKLVALLKQAGVDMINFTAANPYYNPHVGRPFTKEIRGGYPEPEHPIVGVKRLIDLAGEIQQANPEVGIVGTGYSWLGHLMPEVMAGVKLAGKAQIMGAGRMAFAYPDFAKDLIQEGALNPKKVCIACSGCTQIMRDGNTTGCTIRDRDIYVPIFKQGLQKEKEAMA